jgi:hypothetical protein
LLNLSVVALFVCLVICTFYLVFLAGTIFFSHNKSAHSTFSHDFLAKRTDSQCFSLTTNQRTILFRASRTNLIIVPSQIILNLNKSIRELKFMISSIIKIYFYSTHIFVLYILILLLSVCHVYRQGCSYSCCCTGCQIYYSQSTSVQTVTKNHSLVKH